MILFMDLDGTLLSDDKDLTPGNLSAIQEALRAGHQAVIASGRPLASAKILAKELGLDKEGCYVIAYNGGEIYDTYRQQSIFRKSIPLPYVKWVFEEAQKRGLHCQTYSQTSVLAEQDNERLRYYMERTNIPLVLTDDVTRILTEEPVKMIVIDEDHRKLEQYLQETSAWAAGKLDRIFSNPMYLEHVACGISKGRAVTMLCEKLKIPLSQAIAAGDEENDLSMIEAAGTGVVMRNAAKEIQAHADYVTERDNNHDGIAEIIHKFMLK